jgi:hypothetical protein
MLKRFLLIIPAIVLLAAACTSGEDEKETPAVDTPEPVATATEEAVAPEEPDEEHLALSGDSFNPLELLSGSVLGMGSGTTSSALGWTAGGDVDPALKESLLRPEDLPPGYSSLGVMEFSFSPDEAFLDTPGAQEGPLEMAAAMFFEGDMMSDDVGTMVMSAAMVLPEDVMAEALSGFDEAALLDEEALEELEQAEAMYGIRYEDLRVLDASGLGGAGVGMHMVMSFEGGMFAQMPEPDPFAAGMAFDMYMFLRGGKALMLGTIWPADQASSLDSRSLAEIMDARALEAF